MEYENRFTNEQYIKVLEDGSKDLSKFAMDLQLFFASLFRAASFTEILVHGNIAGNMAVEWARKIWTLAGSGQKHASVLPAAKRPTSRQRKWTRQHTYPVEGLNMQDPNSALVTIFGLGEYTITKSLTLALLSSVLNQPVYNQLRTIEQNGYLVFSGASVHIQEGVLGFYIAVQSPWNEPGNMSHSVDLLVQNTLQEAVDKLADADFEKERSAMIAGKLAPFEELSEETSFYWGEIGLRRYAFNHPRDDAALLKSLTKDDVKKLFSEYIGLPHASDRTQLSIWMYPPNRTDASIPPAGTKLPEAAGETISSPAEFCKKHPDFWKPLFPWKENIGLPVRPVVSKKPPPLR
jgi:insulysin